MTLTSLDYRPTRVDIFGYRGDDLTARLTFRDPATGDPIDITSWDLLAQVRTSRDADTVIATLTCAKVDPTHGRLDVTLAAADSAQLEARFFWDLERTLAGRTRTLVGGKFTVDADVSRAP